MKKGWVLYDQGKIGTYRQCLSLKNWLEKEYPIVFEDKTVDLKKPYRWFPPQLMKEFNYSKKLLLQNDDSSLPDLIIAGGRQATNLALTLRKTCFTMIVQNPHICSSYFDIVIPPLHDNVKGKNVCSTLGALHPITADEIKELRNQYYEGPTITVLIGGDSKHFKYTTDYIDQLANYIKERVDLAVFCQKEKIFITASRRSNPTLIHRLREQLQNLTFEIWDNQGANPYLKYLSCADTIIVTGDSISMMSEACITGKPVYIHETPTSSKRINHFIKNLFKSRYAFSLKDNPSTLSYIEPLNELERIKPCIRRSLTNF